MATVGISVGCDDEGMNSVAIEEFQLAHEGFTAQALPPFGLPTGRMISAMKSHATPG